MTDDEIAAYHEAAHAAVAYCSEWLDVADDLVLLTNGHGDAAVKMDPDAIQKALAEDGDFTGDIARQELIHAFLAGAAVERELVSRGMAAISEVDILSAASTDYECARNVLGKMIAPLSLSDYESGVAMLFKDSIPWCIVEGLAKELLVRRTIPLGEIPTVIDRIGEACEETHAPSKPEK